VIDPKMRRGLARLEWELSGGWPGLIGRLLGFLLKWATIGACLSLGWRAIP
jgi:hypothetical protein